MSQWLVQINAQCIKQKIIISHSFHFFLFLSNTNWNYWDVCQCVWYIYIFATIAITHRHHGYVLLWSVVLLMLYALDVNGVKYVLLAHCIFIYIYIYRCVTHRHTGEHFQCAEYLLTIFFFFSSHLYAHIYSLSLCLCAFCMVWAFDFFRPLFVLLAFLSPEKIKYATEMRSRIIIIIGEVPFSLSLSPPFGNDKNPKPKPKTKPNEFVYFYYAITVKWLLGKKALTYWCWTRNTNDDVYLTI